MTKKLFEVETRIHFETTAAAFNQIPFLETGLTRENSWTTIHYGSQLYIGDQILRIGKVQPAEGEPRLYLGWKGPDQGKFANIREEMDEEITTGIKNSAILQLIQGETEHPDACSVAKELEKLNYYPFMEFSGTNRSGFYEPIQLHLKLMYCPILRWPLIVELEKTAVNYDEALNHQDELEQLVSRLGLTCRALKEEPPTLLYETLPSQSGYHYTEWPL